MLIWGGYTYGARYNPVTDSWPPVTAQNSLNLTEHTAVWDGTEMLIFGGFDGDSYLDTTWSYTPPTVMYIYQKP